jgi:hypothetical protein
MNPVTWDETNGYEATRIYRENAVAAVSTVVLSQDGACMAGLKGKSGPPGNMNAFKHGLAAIQKQREENITITSSSDEFSYDFQGATIWSSPALLPFSERDWIDPKMLCKGLLCEPERPASRPQFVCKRQRHRKWIITEELENSR